MKVHCNLNYEQISKEEFKEIEKRMFPGTFCTAGFLQLGETLKEVRENDRLYLEQVGITCDQIADILTCIINKCYRAQYLKRQDDFHYKIETVTYMGAQQCPFQNKKLDNRYHGYEYGDSDHTITDKITGNSIKFNTLLIHMIKDHHFFESPLSQHRLDPKKVIEMFELKSGIDYKPQYKYFNRWNINFCCNEQTLTTDKVNALSEISLKTYQIDKDITGFLLPYNFVLDEDFFTLILLQYDLFSWDNFLTEYLEEEDDEEEKQKISCKIDKILKRIDNYHNNNKINKMYLYILNFSDRRDKFKITVEGIDIKYNSSKMETTYYCTKVNYVPLDDEID